jgi:hypothetical protein
MRESRIERPPGDVLLVWALLGAFALAVLVTYSRLPTSELYHVSERGLAGGAGRMIVYLNFPVALVAVGVVGALLERGARPLPAWVGIALCAVTPFVVDQDDLDFKPSNALPALGVLIAIALTIKARPQHMLAPRRQLDPLRVIAAAAILVLSVPWFFAELGFYAPDPILADEVPAGEVLRAVHAGHHHGTDGMLLTLSALLLSRLARSWPLRAYVALMFVYGAANALQDAWNEQLVKRGTTDVEIPSVLLPNVSLAWGVLVAAAAILFALSLLRPEGSTSSRASAGAADASGRT